MAARTSRAVVTRADVDDVLARAGNHPTFAAIFLLGWLSTRVSRRAERILIRAIEHLDAALTRRVDTPREW